MKSERFLAEIYSWLDDFLWKLEEMVKIVVDEEIEKSEEEETCQAKNP